MKVLCEAGWSVSRSDRHHKVSHNDRKSAEVKVTVACLNSCLEILVRKWILRHGYCWWHAYLEQKAVVLIFRKRTQHGFGYILELNSTLTARNLLNTSVNLKNKKLLLYRLECHWYYRRVFTEICGISSEIWLVRPMLFFTDNFLVNIGIILLTWIWQLPFKSLPIHLTYDYLSAWSHKIYIKLWRKIF
jgi:hypothetical protein